MNELTFARMGGDGGMPKSCVSLQTTRYANRRLTQWMCYRRCHEVKMKKQAKAGAFERWQ